MSDKIESFEGLIVQASRLANNYANMCERLSEEIVSQQKKIDELIEKLQVAESDVASLKKAYDETFSQLTKIQEKLRVAEERIKELEEDVRFYKQAHADAIFHRDNKEIL